MRNRPIAPSITRPLMIAAATFCLGAMVQPAQAQATPAAPPQLCDIKGLKWNENPVFRSSLHPTQRERGVARIACVVEDIREVTAGDTRLRLTRGRLHDGNIDDPKLSAALITVELLGADKPEMIGRIFLGVDPLDGDMRFEPQFVLADGGPLLRLSPRHWWIYRLENGGLTSESAFSWRSKIDDAFPDDARSGENLSVDLDRMEGRVAVRKMAKDPEQGLASAFEPARMVVASLKWEAGRLVTQSTTVRERKTGEYEMLDRVAEMDGIIKTELKGLPDGVEPCSLGAWSDDTDPKGLNVRATPDARGKIIGIVPPPRKMPKDQDALGPEPVKAEFRIIGFKNGWFLIDNISAPGVGYGVSYPKHLPQPHKGRGWVNARMVGAAFANGGLPEGRLYLSPHADAGFIDAQDAEGYPIGADGSPKRILACSGWWALIDTNEGQRGWKRTLCSNQVTNCS